MKYLNITSIITLILVTTILTAIPAQASTVTQTNCSVASLQGTYRFIAPATVAVGQGTVIAIPEAYFDASPAALASEGTVTFDGNGAAMLEGSADRAGKLTNAVSYAGTYTLEANCAAMVTFHHDTSFALQIVQSGSRQRVVSLTPGFVLTTAQ